jgi:DNA end-binding protein Ku
MPARAISSGTISFGLVSIPVKIYTATSSKSVRFSMLHESDRSRLKQKYVCSSCGSEVSRDETVRGYEYSRGQYVVLSDDELKGLQKKSDEAMTESGRVAVGRYSTRGRQQLVLVRPARGGLVLHGLFYADEVRGFSDIEIDEEIQLKENELELAKQLIEQLSHEVFDPSKYEDEYRQAILEAVDRKVAGEEVVVMPKAEPREKIIDLVAALKQSLAEKRGAEPAAKPARKPAKGKGKKAAPKRKASS